MKIYNEDKTKIIEQPDLQKGYLISDRLLISNEEAEEYHFEYIEYEGAGREKVRVIDKPYKPAEYEDIQVYVEYTAEELKNNRMIEIQSRMNELSQDFIQVTVGAKIDDINDRILEFQTLHNELRTLQGKEVRKYGSD